MRDLYIRSDGSADPPAPASPVSLGDRAYATLRARLVSLSVAPGAPIDEERLMGETGLGRTPIREAVRRLALEGLVVVHPRRGTFASEINITDLSHISDVRRVLEGHAAALAAELAAPADRTELAALAAALATLDGAAPRLMEADADVHRLIYRCCRNPYLARDLERYFGLSQRIWNLTIDRLPPLPGQVAELEALLDAICAGDAARARSLAVAHIDTFAREIRAVL